MGKVDFTTVDDPTAECYEPKPKKVGNASVIIGVAILIVLSGGVIYELQKAYKRKETRTAGL